MWTKRVFLLFAVLCGLVAIAFIYIALNAYGRGALAWMLYGGGGFLAFLVFGIAYGIWTVFFSKKVNTRRKIPAKSQFFFTKEGEIIEVVDDEKRKRSE